METDEGDWHEVRMLDDRYPPDQPLEMSDAVRELIRRTAPTVALAETETEANLVNGERARALLHEMRRRITEGSNRLSDALHRMYRLRDAKDLDGARQQLRDVLAVEVVPLYKEIAESELERLDAQS